MTKVDSDSFNQNDYGVQVTNYLNKGILNGYEKFIDKPYLGLLIDRFYFSLKRSYKKSDILEVRDKVYAGLEDFLEKQPSLMDKKWSLTQLLIITYMISIGDNNVENIEKIAKAYKEIGYPGVYKSVSRVNADIVRAKTAYEKGVGSHVDE